MPKFWGLATPWLHYASWLVSLHQPNCNCCLLATKTLQKLLFCFQLSLLLLAHNSPYWCPSCLPLHHPLLGSLPHLNFQMNAGLNVHSNCHPSLRFLPNNCYCPTVEAAQLLVCVAVWSTKSPSFCCSSAQIDVLFCFIQLLTVCIIRYLLTFRYYLP